MHRGAVAHTLRLGLLVAGVLAVYGCEGGAKPLSEEYGSLSPEQIRRRRVPTNAPLSRLAKVGRSRS